ncbi:Uncharacterized protein QTN25_009994 [Entamoeba marina]
MSTSSTSDAKSIISRNRKRASRSTESCITNSIVYVFISHLNASASFRKTKKTKQTVKMILPESITIDGTTYDQTALASYNEFFMKEVLGETPMDINQMNDKQYNRSKEAQINNGMLYLLKAMGYNYTIKQTKRTKCTERLVKINSLTTPYGDVIDSGLLEEIGVAFGKKVESLFGREMNINVTFESCSDGSIPMLPLSYQPLNDSNSFPESYSYDQSVVNSYDQSLVQSYTYEQPLINAYSSLEYVQVPVDNTELYPKSY